MTRRTLATISIGLLLATLPLWSADTTRVFGFPLWAFIVFLSTTVYAVAISCLLNRYWLLMAGTEEPQDHA